MQKGAQENSTADANGTCILIAHLIYPLLLTF